MGHKELLPEPDLEDRKKAKAAKTATEVIMLRSQYLFHPSSSAPFNFYLGQVTPAQISAKAQQMVEMVKASQVVSIKIMIMIS